MAAADIEAHDLDGAGCGTANLEVMAAGVPTIVGVLPDNFLDIELRSGENIVLVPPGSSEALGRAIVAVLSDPEGAERIGAGQQALDPLGVHARCRSNKTRGTLQRTRRRGRHFSPLIGAAFPLQPLHASSMLLPGARHDDQTSASSGRRLGPPHTGRRITSACSLRSCRWNSVDGAERMTDMYFPEDEEADLAHIRSEILRYRSTFLMNDRERARFLGLPDGCRMRENAKIISPENLVCGTNVWIGEGAVLDASGGLEIGDNTQVGLGVFIWSHTTHKQAVAGETARDSRLISRRATRIGSNCFLAGPSVIAPGITVGDKAIISPLSFVQEDVPSGGVVSNRALWRASDKRMASLEAELETLRSRLDDLENRN